MYNKVFLAKALNMRVFTIQMKLDFVLFLILLFHNFGTVLSSNTHGIDSGPVDSIEATEADRVRDKRSTHHRSHGGGGGGIDGGGGGGGRGYGLEMANSENGIDGYNKTRGTTSRDHNRKRSGVEAEDIADSFGRYKARKPSYTTFTDGHHHRPGSESNLGRDGVSDNKYNRVKGAYDDSLPIKRHHGHKKQRGYGDDYQV